MLSPYCAVLATFENASRRFRTFLMQIEPVDLVAAMIDMSQSHIHAILPRNLRVELLPGSPNSHLCRFGGILQVLMKAFEAPINCKSFPCLELFVARLFPPHQHWQLPESPAKALVLLCSNVGILSESGQRVFTSQTRILKFAVFIVFQVLPLQVS